MICSSAPSRAASAATSSGSNDSQLTAASLPANAGNPVTTKGRWNAGSASSIRCGVLDCPLARAMTCHVRRRVAKALRRLAALHRDGGLEAVDIAIDRRHRERLAAAPVAQHAILAHHVAVDRDLVPLLGVADIVDRHV